MPDLFLVEALEQPYVKAVEVLGLWKEAVGEHYFSQEPAAV